MERGTATQSAADKMVTKTRQRDKEPHRYGEGKRQGEPVNWAAVEIQQQKLQSVMVKDTLN